MGPVRFHLYRQVRRRAEALGRSVAGLHEDIVPGEAARTPAEGAGVH
jgi:hypothetical protein